MAEAPARQSEEEARQTEKHAPGENRERAPTDVPQTPPRSELMSVWSRPEPKYRYRAIILLVVNLLFFCGLCVFTNWLHVGKPFDFTPASYGEPMRFWGEQTQNLNDFILFPINVSQTPMHGVVLGLLLASIVAIPISVSLLYGFKSAVPFSLAVLVFAHMPWMCVTLIGSCILASVRPFRMSFRFGSALLALLPVLLYLYLATRPTPEQAATFATPDEKLLLVAPWALAIVAACVMMGAILAISRLVNYRPGAVAPVMAIMFGTPAVLFHMHVGIDELDYRVLEARYGPRAAVFEPVRDVTHEVSTMFARWNEAAQPDDPRRGILAEILSGRVEALAALKQQVAQRLLRDFLGQRRAAVVACVQFIANHPGSRYVPNVLFIQGRVLDTRLDERRLFTEGTRIRRELYSDFPHVQSESVWSALLNEYPHSPLFVAANLRLAQLELRRGEARAAMRLLNKLDTWRSDSVESEQSAGDPSTRPSLRGLLTPTDPETSLGFDPEPYLLEARRLRELITNNRNDPHYGVEPLVTFARLDPHRRMYPIQLRRLASEFRDSLLYDNLVVRWAATLPNRARRADQLEACIGFFTSGDALPEAMFRLADLEIQTLGNENATRREAGVARMRAVAERFPDTYWGWEAAERLRILQPKEDAAVPEGDTPS